MTPRYFTATVADNADPEELGRLSLVIPGLSGPDDPYPEWIAPRVAPGAGPDAGWWWIPPVDAIVIVEVDAAGGIRWSGGTWGAVNTPPPFLVDNYPRRAGFTSPEGAQVVAVDEDQGVILLVASGATVDVTTDPELLTPVEGVILGATFLGDLGPALVELVAVAAASGLPAPNLSTLVGKVTASTSAAGAPYLSTTLRTV